MLGGWYRDQVDRQGQSRVESALVNLRCLTELGVEFAARHLDLGDLLERRFGGQPNDESTYLKEWLLEEGEALLERTLQEQAAKLTATVSA